MDFRQEAFEKALLGAKALAREWTWTRSFPRHAACETTTRGYRSVSEVAVQRSRGPMFALFELFCSALLLWEPQLNFHVAGLNGAETELSLRPKTYIMPLSLAGLSLADGKGVRWRAERDVEKALSGLRRLKSKCRRSKHLAGVWSHFWSPSDLLCADSDTNVLLVAVKVEFSDSAKEKGQGAANTLSSSVLACPGIE